MRLSVFVCVNLCQKVLAQPYPAKPVRLIIPFPAGGGTDLIGFEPVLKAPPDGYTLGMGTISALAISPSIEAQGNIVSPGTAEEFEKFIVKETSKWRQVITTAGIRME